MTFTADPAGAEAVLLAGKDVTTRLRTEDGRDGRLTSGRDARGPHGTPGPATRFRTPPGLVADGRDMGTVVFPDAQLKIYLTASARRAGPETA